MDRAEVVSLYEEDGRLDKAVKQSSVQRAGLVDLKVKVPGSGAYTGRNKLVRQTSQDHEQNEEKLQHSDSGQGQSLFLEESQDEDSASQQVRRSFSNPGPKTQSGETLGTLTHSDSGQGQSLALGESQDEDNPPQPVRRSLSQPGTKNASNKSEDKLTHSNAGQYKSLALEVNQEKENSKRPVNQSVSYSGIASNLHPRHSVEGSFPLNPENPNMNQLSPLSSFQRQASNRTENIDSGIEKTPSIGDTHFPFGSGNVCPTNKSVCIQCSTCDEETAGETETPVGSRRDKQKQIIEGRVYHGTTETYEELSDTNSYECFSEFSSFMNPWEQSETSISPPGFSHVTPSYQSIPSPRMVTKSSFDQLSRELSKARNDRDKQSEDIIKLQNRLSDLSRELDDSRHKFFSLVNLEEIRKQELHQVIINLRTQLKCETTTRKQLSMKIEELNNQLDDQNKQIKKSEKENNDLKMRNAILEKEIEKLWKKEGERLNGDSHKEHDFHFPIHQRFSHEPSSDDDTIPKEPHLSPEYLNLNVNFRPK